MSSGARIRFADPSLDEIAGLLAGCHPCAADYLAQAPVIAVLAPEKFGSHLTYGEIDRFGATIAAAPKLRDVLQSYRVPTPARKFSAGSIRLKDRAAIRQMCMLDGSTLSQVIAEPEGQRVVLDGVAKWLILDPDSSEADKSGVAWVARHLRADPSRIEMVDSLLDFLGRGGGKLNERWSWDRAVAEVVDWHRKLNDANALQRMLRSTSQAALFEVVICKAPIPDATKVDGYDFIALRTPRAIREEGAAMHHCAASYCGSVMTGESTLISIRREGLNVATLELNRRGEVVQIKSHCNKAPTKKVRDAAGLFALLHWGTSSESAPA